MSRLFREIVRARSAAYERGYLKARRLDHPVISIGNLTTGGTGKTPLVIAIAAAMGQLGYRPVILSRGYRRRSRGLVVVGRGNGPEVPWEDSGDEPFMMALRLPGVSVVVGVDRFEAGRRAEAEGLGNLFILDDGFQHRRLHRDVDLVAIDPADWRGEERLLPTGNWREPRTALGRAHAACVRREQGHPEIGLPVPSFEFAIEPDGIVRNGEWVARSSLAETGLVAFAGIAKPGRFFRTLKSMGLRVDSTRSFPDHHVFRPSELAALPPGTRITTEKDAVRLPPGDFCFLRVSANILNFEALRDLVLERIGPRTS